MKINQDGIKRTNEIYGEDYMTCLAMEEFSEVIQALNKVKRYGKTEATLDHLNEEVSDCLIVIESLKDLGLLDEQLMQKWIDYKQARQEIRNEIGADGLC